MIKLRTHMNENQKHLKNKTQEKGVSKWLKTCLICDQVYDLNKQQLKNCIRFRYGLGLRNITST